MDTQSPHVNLPIEALRTVKLIAECGTYTRAADILGLSQPAVSAQMRKLEKRIGGSVFVRTPQGLALTRKGESLMPLVDKLLAASDQILRLGGRDRESSILRIGIASPVAKLAAVRSFGDAALKRRFANTFDDIRIQSGTSQDIAKGLLDGWLDVGCLENPPPELPEVDEQKEELLWVRGPSTTIPPGRPMPLINWLTCPKDRIAREALTAQGIPFEVVFASSDTRANKLALAQGLGVMAWTQRLLEPTMVPADDYGLPPLPPLSIKICHRPDLPERTVDQLPGLLAALSASDDRAAA